MLKNWTLIGVLTLAVPCAAQEDEAPAEESIQAPVGSRHYESADADQAPHPPAEESAPAASSGPSGYEAPGISRQLGVPRPPVRTPSRASGGGATAAGPARTARGPHAVVRSFLTGYVGVPYLAVPYAMLAPRTPYFKETYYMTGDDSFGYDMEGVPTYKAVPLFAITGLPAGLSVWKDGNAGKNTGVVSGVPLQAGSFSALMDLGFLTAGITASGYKGRISLKILPEPRHTVLNPDERSTLSVRFENDGPALLKVTFGQEGDPYTSVALSADGVTNERVYFEAHIEKVGDEANSRVGISAGKSPEELPEIGYIDSWGFMLNGQVALPGGTIGGVRVGNGRLNDAHKLPFHEYQRLTHRSKAVPGDLIMVAFDPAEGKLWFGKNGRWFDGGDPAAGISPTIEGIELPGSAYHGDFRAAVEGAAGTTFVLNFGDQPWKYELPRGFAGIRHHRSTGLHARPHGMLF